MTLALRHLPHCPLQPREPKCPSGSPSIHAAEWPLSSPPSAHLSPPKQAYADHPHLPPSFYQSFIHFGVFALICLGFALTGHTLTMTRPVPVVPHITKYPSLAQRSVHSRCSIKIGCTAKSLKVAFPGITRGQYYLQNGATHHLSKIYLHAVPSLPSSSLMGPNEDIGNPAFPSLSLLPSDQPRVQMFIPGGILLLSSNGKGPLSRPRMRGWSRRLSHGASFLLGHPDTCVKVSTQLPRGPSNYPREGRRAPIVASGSAVGDGSVLAA